MISVKVLLQDKDQRHINPFPEYQDRIEHATGSIVGIVAMQEGTVEGKTGIVFMVEHENTIVPVTTSAAMLLTLAEAVKGAMGRWDEKWDDGTVDKATFAGQLSAALSMTLRAKGMHETNDLVQDVLKRMVE